jgi:hypothetical protein
MPTLPNDLWIWRKGVVGEHRGCPGKIVTEEAATHVVNVVGVAIIG